MTRSELYKKLNDKRVACMGKILRYKEVGVFKSGRMCFTVSSFKPLKRGEFTATTYYLYKSDVIEDKVEYILIRGNGDRYIRIFY